MHLFSLGIYLKVHCGNPTTAPAITPAARAHADPVFIGQAPFVLEVDEDVVTLAVEGEEVVVVVVAVPKLLVDVTALSVFEATVLQRGFRDNGANNISCCAMVVDPVTVFDPDTLVLRQVAVDASGEPRKAQPQLVDLFLVSKGNTMT